MIEVRFQRGVHLPELDLWLDPWEAKPHAFVSHAHADHFARHESVLCSDVTSVLLRRRYNLAEGRIDAHAFHVPILRDGFRLRLLPAGHISGSAMLHVTRSSDNASLLYTGDFKTRRSRTAEPVVFLAADTLILETTFGLPVYQFPSAMEAEAGLVRFVQDTLADGETPVLLAYSLGKAQELVALLAEQEIPTVQHPAVAEMTRACIEAGVEGLPEPVEFDGHMPEGHVLITPPHTTRGKALAGIESKRTAMISGWSMQPGARFRYRAGTMIPLSDHADHPGLLECVKRVRPRRILTLHGFSKEFAAELRGRGHDAWCASGGDQLDLPIAGGTLQQGGAARAPRHQRVLSQLADFTDLCRLVAETGSQRAKCEFLRSHLITLEDDEDLAITARLLAGDGGAPLQALTLRHALAELPGVSRGKIRTVHAGLKDWLLSTRQILEECPLRPEAMSLKDTREFLEEFDAAGPSLERVRMLAARWLHLHPAEGETLAKLLFRDLRLGLDTELIDSAIATAFDADAGAVRKARSRCKDIGHAAVLARHGDLDSAEAPEPSQDSGTPTAKPATGWLPLDSSD
ncbi:MAG: hypothetical protein H7A49_16730 [Akkermansiaceae bacterium]|nr:hypothetical protein [Akkermansiaceae bacterium]MCP5545543.1 hypothetical protein [Akkermansiaceae bacterium]MCP5546747.1 hypothetical protein [Akkermansiaceae bacterium]